MNGEPHFISEVWKPPFTQLRQEIICKLEKYFTEMFNEKIGIVTYIQNTMNPIAAAISSMSKTQEAILFDAIQKAIFSCEENNKEVLLLIINSLGGDPHMVDNIVRTIYEGLKIPKFYVAIPHFAKSAASLMALASDKIIVGPLTELGPVDPQLPIPTHPPQLISCNLIKRLFENTINELTKNKKIEEIAIIRSQLPILLYQQAIDAISFTKELIKRLVLEKEKILESKHDIFMSRFVDSPLSHGEVIKPWDIQDLVRDDFLIMLDSSSNIWKYLQELYARSLRHLQAEIPSNSIGLILVESRNSSFSFNAHIEQYTKT